MTSASPSNSDFPISGNLKDVPKSATLAINELSKQLIRQGKDVIAFGLGQSPFPVPDIMVNALKDFASSKDYMAVQGYLPLREAIAGYLQRSEQLELTADNILIGPGSKELLFGLQMALDCDLVLPAPSWVSYEPQARLLDKTVHWLPCFADNGWKLTAETLEQHCQQHADRRQLLIINSPNNPSGACFNDAELQALAAVAAEWNVIVLSDEIYSQMHYQGQHVSIAQYYPQGTIISNGISKWAGAGGWRLGFFAFPDTLLPILQAMQVIASESFTSVSAPIQMAAISAFQATTEMQDYIQASRKIMAVAACGFSDRLQYHGVECVAPEGGFYVLADYGPFQQALEKRGIVNDKELCHHLLEDTGVAGLPGHDFGLTSGLYVRYACVDFDAETLLPLVLNNHSMSLELSSPPLRRIFDAGERIGQWLQRLS